jgi:hypothetical protein
MNTNFLTQEDLEDLTGYKLPSKQAVILAQHKINYVERKDGKLRVTWDQVNKQGASAAANDESGFNPDFMQNG